MSALPDSPQYPGSFCITLKKQQQQQQKLELSPPVSVENSS